MEEKRTEHGYCIKYYDSNGDCKESIVNDCESKDDAKISMQDKIDSLLAQHYLLISAEWY